MFAWVILEDRTCVKRSKYPAQNTTINKIDEITEKSCLQDISNKNRRLYVKTRLC